MSLATLARDMRQPSPSVQAPRDMAPQPAGTAKREEFDGLVKYIPTETVTIFVAICSARSAVETITGGGFPYLWIYLACAALTPILLVLIAVGRKRSAERPVQLDLHWWPLAAATFAFLIWALSVPGVTSIFSPTLAKQDAWGVVAGVGALIVSGVLSLLEPVCGPRPSAV